MESLMLSIYIATYNHEAYIERALDSVLMQKTQYSYEVLIGEDCSTDNTRNVLKRYEMDHPGKFTVFYREKNMRSIGLSNAADLKSRCKGKYIIALEGDDYWIDEYKIEKQIAFLESNSEYLAVAHNCIVVNEKSEPNGEKYPECKDEEYTIGHFVSDIFPGQLTTVMYRNYYINDYMDTTLVDSKIAPGDRLIYFSLIANGKIFCMQEVMSAYRHIVDSGSSYSANCRYSFVDEEKFYAAILLYSYQNKKLGCYKMAELMYVACLFRGLRYKAYEKRKIVKYLNNVENKCLAILLCIKFYFNRYILKKDICV